jgi:hypothetical protein
MTDKKPTDVAFDPLPSPQEFCLTVPLYEKFKFDKNKSSPLFAFEMYKGTLDCFCHGCQRHSVFHRLGEPQYTEYAHLNDYIFELYFACSRDTNHRITFMFRSHQGILQKIGQFPSLADLATPDLQKYRPVLGDERFRELTRAVGLASHGVGIGAFVYLRRIFEHLIDKARHVASGQPGWDQAAFDRSRMDDKIVTLKDHLPSFLVANLALYGIMSGGTHTVRGGVPRGLSRCPCGDRTHP